MMSEEAPKVGRPSSFSREIGDEICERIAKGESVRSIITDPKCDWMPGQTTFYRWLAENEKFRDQYVHACEMRADHFVDEMIEIADAPNASVDESGNPVLRDPQRDRLRIDTRKWIAARMSPKRYGDKVDLNHGGSLTVEIQRFSAD